MNRRRLYAMCLTLLVLVTGCDPGASGILNVIITAGPSPTIVEVGAGQNLLASAADANGKIYEVEFASLSPAIATVNASGRIVGVAVGTTVVTVNVKGGSGREVRIDVTVTAPSIKVAVTPTVLVLRPTEASSFACTTRNANNDSPLTGVAVTWSTSNAAVATVSPSGVVTGIADGDVQIKCTVTGGTANAISLVTVRTPPLSINVSPSPMSVQQGATSQATVVLRDENNTVVTGRTITYTVLNTAFATVNASGLVTGVAPGTTTLRVTVAGPGGGTADVALTVPAPILGVTLSASSLQLAPEISAPLTCTVRNTTTGGTLNLPVTWTSSAPGIATVSATGVVTAVADGTANITCTVTGTTTSATAAVTVTTAPLTITISPSPVTLQVGATASTTTTVATSTGQAVTGRTITYVSANPGVATVSATGVVTGVAVGSTTVTATVSGAGGGTKNVTVTVGAPELIVTMDPTSLTLDPGTFGTFTCTVRNKNNNAIVTGQTIVWNSAVGSIATVGSSSGVVTAVSGGTTQVSCNVTSAPTPTSATGTVTVNPPLVITVTPNPVTVAVAGTSQLSVVATSNGTPVTGRTITYVSRNTSIATANASGLVTGVANGSTVVDVTVGGPGGGTVAVPVTVAAPSCGVSGGQTVIIDVLLDVGGHSPFIPMPSLMVLTLIVSPPFITVQGVAPFINVNGSINASCQISATGSGTVAGFPNTSASLTGLFILGQLFDWTYILGANGTLPGAVPISYRIRKQ